MCGSLRCAVAGAELAAAARLLWSDVRCGVSAVAASWLHVEPFILPFRWLCPLCAPLCPHTSACCSLGVLRGSQAVRRALPRVLAQGACCRPACAAVERAGCFCGHQPWVALLLFCAAPDKFLCPALACLPTCLLPAQHMAHASNPVCKQLKRLALTTVARLPSPCAAPGAPIGGGARQAGAGCGLDHRPHGGCAGAGQL